MSSPAKNSRLTDRKYWNDIHKNISRASAAPQPETAESGQRHPLLRPATNRIINDILEATFAYDESQNIIEVGSAPGKAVLRLHRKFGFEPFGVEYTEAGAAVNRETFRNNGIAEENVIHMDFLSDEFQNTYRDHFDNVISNGFLEHFDDPADVVAKHVNILRPGGKLMITIPNFRYLNYLTRRFYSADFIDSHNLELMTIEAFRACFLRDDFELEICRYAGGFRFPEPTYTVPWKRIVEKITGKLQLPINLLGNTLFRNHPLESRYFSLSLVATGRKTVPGG